MNGSHLFDPKQTAILESKDRKKCQNPEEIIGLLELKPFYVVADLGCGSGYFTIPISRKVKKVYGIDIQKEMLGFIEEKIQKQEILNIKTLRSKENEIPLQNGSVDLLLSVNRLHEFQDKEKIIDEMQRVIKHEGQIAIIDFKKEKINFGPPVAIRISKEKRVYLFEKKGFTFLKSHDLKYHYLIVFRK